MPKKENTFFLSILIYHQKYTGENIYGEILEFLTANVLYERKTTKINKWY